MKDGQILVRLKKCCLAGWIICSGIISGCSLSRTNIPDLQFVAANKISLNRAEAQQLNRASPDKLYGVSAIKVTLSSSANLGQIAEQNEYNFGVDFSDCQGGETNVGWPLIFIEDTQVWRSQLMKRNWVEYENAAKESLKKNGSYIYHVYMSSLDGGRSQASMSSSARVCVVITGGNMWGGSIVSNSVEIALPR